MRQFGFFNISLGTVRKILGVDFVGTTEDSARVYIVDAAIQGFDEAPKVTGVSMVTYMRNKKGEK